MVSGVIEALSPAIEALTKTKPVTKEEFGAKLKAEFDLDVDGGCPRQPAASRGMGPLSQHATGRALSAR